MHVAVKRWRGSVVKYAGQGQSDQAIKLLQMTPYVNDFQILKQNFLRFCDFSQQFRFLTAFRRFEN